jgi:hypothetical protein
LNGDGWRGVEKAREPDALTSLRPTAFPTVNGSCRRTNKLSIASSLKGKKDELVRFAGFDFHPLRTRIRSVFLKDVPALHYRA